MAVVYSSPLIEHVLCLCVARVRGPVGIDVGANVGEEICAITRVGDVGAEAGEFPPVIEEDFAVTGEVVLFQGGGGEGRVGVKKPGELGDEGFALRKSVC